MNDSPYRDTDGAAEFYGRDGNGKLHVSPKSLERWRIESKGPKYRKLGRRVVYHVDDLTAFADKHKHNSTSEAAA